MIILLAIALILLIFWLLGITVFNLGSLIYIALVVGLILAVIWLLRAVFWHGTHVD